MEKENTTNVPVESKGLSIASMVLGIVAVVLCCFGWVSIICAVLAIIFGVIGKKKGGVGMAKAGLILGIIALAVYALLYIIALAGFAALGSFAGDLTNELNNMDFNSIQY